jgi:DNA-binding GntR family transcriptional regulator
MSAGSIYIQPTTPSLADGVVAAVLDGILNGKFTCDQPLFETEVADWLGVSRTPVREALKTLHRQRLLEKDPSRSFVVACWTKQDLKEVAELRTALETLNIELAVSKVLPRQLDTLESIVLQMKGALSRQDYRLLVQLDSEFHGALWQIPGNTRLLQALVDLRPQIRYFQHLTRIGDEHDYPATHSALVSVLRDGDVPQAKKELREHILSSAARAIARLDETQSDDPVDAPVSLDTGVSDNQPVQATSQKG